MILSGFKSFVLKVCETKGFTDVFLRKCVKLRELGEKIGSRQLKVESDRPQTGEKLMPGSGSVSDRALIVILRGVFYHTSTYEVKKILQVVRNEEVGGRRDRLRPL